jgi:predicted O-methyltransferase YrrM
MMNSFNISETALAYAAMRYNRPRWATGTIQRADAAFLFDLIMRERPRAIAELGVASGVSTAFLSTLLADRLPGSRLYSFDKLEFFYADSSRRVGAYVYELFGALPANLSLAPGIASTEIRSWPQRPEVFDFVFLDACHLHPWPCNDLLAILDLVDPGAWVVLHDVWLPLLKRESGPFGPLYLYQMWPGEKCAPFGNKANIGAIRLFENRSDSAAALLDCCKIPWRDQPPYSDWRGSLQALSETDFELHEALRAMLEKPPLAKCPLMRNCEIVIRGANPWSHFAPDPMADRIVLHANRRGEPAISITIRDLDRRHCNGIVFPSIARSDDASCAMSVALTLRASDGRAEVNRLLLLADASTHFVVLMAPDGLGSFDAEISVSPVEDAENMKGAWVKFDAVHFV